MARKWAVGMRNNNEGGDKILAPPTAQWEDEKCRFAVKRKHSETFCESCDCRGWVSKVSGRFVHFAEDWFSTLKETFN